MLNDNRKVYLYCFHHAGGSSQPYRQWERFFPENIKLICIDYPGRVGISETCAKNFDDLLETLEIRIIPSVKNMEQQIAFYGHSMGALVALELAKRMDMHSVALSHLFVSACLSPSKFFAPVRSALSDDLLIQTLDTMGGTGRDQLRRASYQKYFLPLIRADFRILETYTPSKSSLLQCPLTILGSDEDKRVPVSSLKCWSEETTGTFKSFVFKGGHFFNFCQVEQVVDVFKRQLKICNEYTG